ncbi:Asp23/Gls24 family envelope stress response protein [Cumulibacter soli]|uniref:Asp23/Gls24 family envelope stress response protein n=1 Tax=Cumulibacter soli TaxID=2546344 RepID=UPI001067B99B|nr:Asp23/Gls24 family envelope stress response protein [Cumulibacter soli]
MTSSVVSAAPEGTPADADPAARGLTRISPNVVERIAAHACHRADGAITPQLHPAAPRGSAPRARAEINGKIARLTVTVGVQYPMPVAAFAATLRDVVAADVERLCGLHVVAIDVEAAPVNLRRRTRVL